MAAAANKDSSSFIKMRYNDNDIIAYQSSSHNSEFAVFSEIYYDAGWVATIDGKESPIIRTNYVLRGLQVPAGKHEIRFEFKPSTITNSNKAAIGASAIIWLLLIWAFIIQFKKPKSTV